MAKTACYIIDSVGVTGITDFQGAEVVDPQNNQVWECEDDNLDIATWKLYCPQLLDPPKPLDAELIDKAILDYYSGYPVEVLYTFANQLDVNTFTATTPQATGGIAQMVDNGDLTVTLFSEDPVTFIAPNSAYWNGEMDLVTDVEVKSGASLTQLNADDTGSGIFAQCSQVTHPKWNGASSNLTNLIYAFVNCTAMTDAPAFPDTSNVSTWSGAFELAEGLLGVPASYSFEGATDMNGAFADCSSMLAFDGFDLSGVIDNTGVFDGCSSLASVASILSTIGTTHKSMFRGCSSLLCINNISTVLSTDKGFMFDGCIALVQPDATAVTDITDVDGANWTNASPCPAI